MQIQIKEEQANWLRAKGGGVEGFHFPVGEGGDRPFSKTGIPGHRAQPPVSCSRIIPVTRSLSFLRMAPKGYWYKRFTPLLSELHNRVPGPGRWLATLLLGFWLQT